jgi:hypothetical protein
MLDAIYTLDQISKQHISSLRAERCIPCRLPFRLRDL